VLRLADNHATNYYLYCYVRSVHDWTGFRAR
jgi:hypothetical protein